MPLMNVQIRHILSFLAVADEKSFARAAERLHVSQPALSQTIIQFEQTLGFALFERTTRSVMLTAPGKRLLTRARELNRALDALQADAKSLRLALKNQLHVGFMIGTAVEFIPAIIRAFEQSTPEVSLHLREFDFRDPSAGLRDGKVDCAIIRPPIGLDDIELVEIAHEKCVACLPTGHRLSAKRSVRLGDILDEPIVVAPEPGIWRDYWTANEHRGGRPAKIAMEAATVESELQAVASGRGISITSDSTARYYARPGVVFRPITDMADCVVAIGHRGKADGLVADFIDVVKRVTEGSAPRSRRPIE